MAEFFNNGAPRRIPQGMKHAVNIAARVCALAQPMEVLVTRTVKELLGVTALAFTDRGVHALKGVPDSWQVYRID